MKVKVLSRSHDDFVRQTKHDIHKVERNYSPHLHPFETNREYKRAVNAVKMDRMFAKPFLCSLDGHSDIVQCLAKHPTRLSVLLSGAANGELKLWNLADRKCLDIIDGHNSIVRQICVPLHGRYFFSVGDQTIKQWPFRESYDDVMNTTRSVNSSSSPMNTLISQTVVHGMDCHRTKPLLITCGESVDLWEETRTQPLRTYKWGSDSVSCVKFNPIETDLCAGAASDRSIQIYDTRRSEPLRKVIMKMRTNSLAWNPMEAFVFTAANEDSDLYTFDLRNLKAAQQVHKDHVAAVIDVDYSPTGREFVSGSYDKTVRIFGTEMGRSRDVYHTKRMQRLTAVLWSADNKYLVSASDEMDIRLWKAYASEKLGLKSFREQSAADYNQKLMDKFGNHPEVRRIARHRHVPKHVMHASKEKRDIVGAIKRKEGNRRLHSKPGTVGFESERTKSIVSEEQ
ncbi:DDB1- and CUL4-associated factor 13-like [Oppia nitens]|uniref:DDB1- and CUL4-associated factor 13-like n=1 Tax=Oppia nitens TaxID=1686743 RepID=UPI0023DCC68F|nr:DDB1- and CUL4-associated factor 13-like [Oppia nitens]